jgi:hypothetical protein
MSSNPAGWPTPAEVEILQELLDRKLEAVPKGIRPTVTAEIIVDGDSSPLYPYNV